jgi:cell division protease FtsH
MDGFASSGRLVVMAASNLLEKLDPALLRPGRFDRQVFVSPPDVSGRRRILAVHTRTKPLHEDVDLGLVAQQTSGLTGADLANICNEAAIFCARRGGHAIAARDFDDAIERVIAGVQSSTTLSERERRVVAYHEAGHALCRELLRGPGVDRVHKISIVPRGRALGYTLTLPEQDKFMMTREELRDELAMLMGGRVAEEIVAGDISTGAGNDIERATKIAREMVTEHGMSDAIGPRTLGQKQGEVFLGRDWASTPDYSEAVAFEIDQEISHLIDEAHDVALEILTQHRERLDQLAALLLEKETLDREEVEAFFKAVEKRAPRAPEVRSAGLAVSRTEMFPQPDAPGPLRR